MQTEKLFHRVRQTIERYHMITAGETVLVAVSGGADSMCLLHLLKQISHKNHFAIQAATFSHQIRPEGEQDAEFVQRWCESQGIVCHRGTGNVPAEAKRLRQGIEETARQMRYAFLQQTAQAMGALHIATAHNANDNAETLLLHLVRGTGLNGLGGISPVRQNIIRPLIEIERSDIESYVSQANIPHVEDTTNADTAYSRNYIRHEVLPLLMHQNPKLLSSLGHTAACLRQDEEYLTEQAAAVTASAEQRTQNGSVSMEIQRLTALPEAIANRVLEQLMEKVAPESVLSGANRAALRRLCHSDKPSGQIVLSGGIVARRVYDRLILSPKQPPQNWQSVTLLAGEQITFGGRILTCTIAVCPKGKFNRPNCYYLKGDEQTNIIVRSRQAGDAVTLPSRGQKTLKKLLIEHKIPQQERTSVAVLQIGGKVAAVDGFGADIAFLPSAGEQCLRIVGVFDPQGRA